jgi:hypothetical protein
MMKAIDLTPEQSERLRSAGSTPAMRDPQSNVRYVLLKEELYAELFNIGDSDEEQRNLRLASTQGAARRLLDEEQ